MKKLLAATFLLFSLGACGVGSDDAEYDHVYTTYREAKVRLSPAVDFSNLFDPDLKDRIVIDEIEVNVSDVRLLGPHPSIPEGGLELLNQEVQIGASEDGVRIAELPFPEVLINEDLSVYVMIAPSETLDESSVVVRGRLFESAMLTGLATRGLEKVDPDGEPADKPGTEEVDPDGEPADKGGGEPIDPDGEPADRANVREVDPDGEPADFCGRSIVCAESTSPSALPKMVAFELRAGDLADMLIGFGTESSFDVVLGVPAARWLTEDAVAEIERELERPVVNPFHESDVMDRSAVVIEGEDARVQNVDRPDTPSDEPIEEGEGDYRLHRGDDIDPNRVRQH